MQLKKAILTLASALLIGGTSAMADVITGRVLDNADKSPMMEASVRVKKATRDSAFVTGVSADAEGRFRITGVKSGKYVVEVSYIGYNTLKKNVTLNGKTVALGDLLMDANSIMLQEAVVTGVKSEIVVKEDTVEYNADSYKTQVNAVVEDLLKRLPGVEVDSEGNITAQGKTVSKILIDGKEFFGDDPKVATKNIPVNMVDKLQVVDRKSDLARTTGVDDGEDETVINLTVKKGMNNGWFGNVAAGYGTSDRYGATAMINHFRDGNQFTILGGANNTNNMGFSDGGAGRFQRFGGNNGLRKSQNIGMNFNIGSQDERFRFGGNVMYSHTDNLSLRRSSSETKLKSANDSVSYRTSDSQSNDRGHNVRAGFRLKWEVDSFNTIEFRPNFSYNHSDGIQSSTSATYAGQFVNGAWQRGQQVNQSVSNETDGGNSYDFGGEFVFNHKFRSHPGRSFSVQMRYNLSNTREKSTSLTQNTLYLLEDPDQTIDQIIRNHQWSNTVQGRVTWTEPLGNVAKGNFLQFAYRGQYRFNNADKYVYDRIQPQIAAYRTYNFFHNLLADNEFRSAVAADYGVPALNNYALLNDILKYETIDNYEINERQSNLYRNNYFNQTFQAGFKKTTADYNLDAGLQLTSAMMSGKDLVLTERNIEDRWSWAVAPYARFRYKFSKTRNLQFNYRARNSQPSLTQLQPVADESNPLNIRIGNPDLKPTFTHNFDLRFNDFNQESQRSMMFFIRGSFAQNSIISKITNNPLNGGRTTTYENTNGVWNMMGMGMLSVPLRNKKFYFNNHTFIRYSRSVGYEDDNKYNSGSFSINLGPGLAFRTDVVDIQVRPNYSFQNTHSGLTGLDKNTHSYGASADGTLYLGNFVLNTDVHYTESTGYSAGYNSSQWIWNASLEWMFFKKQATLGVKAFDMLNQRTSIFRSNTANSVTDSWNNSLGRYVLFTISYRFNTFGKNAPQGAAMRYGGGPGGNPGRGPGGGGPGRRF